MKNFLNKFKILVVGISILYGANSVFSQDFKSAVNLTRSEQFDIAAKAYKELIKNDPMKGDYYYYYAENFLSSYFVDTSAVSLPDMIDSANIILKNGSVKDPYNPLIWVGIGKNYLYSGDKVNANVNFDKAISFLPSKKNKNSEIPKDRQAVVYAKIAEGYVIVGSDTNKAFSYLQIANGLDPKNTEIYILTGEAYMTYYNDGTNAIKNYNQAQELDPKSPLAKMKIGNIYVRGRNLNAAIPIFEEAVLIDPNFAPVYRELGELYYKAGKYDNAKTNYEKFLALSNKNISAKARYASFLYLTQDYEGAIKEINEIILIDSSSNILNRLIAYSYYETNKYDSALTYIEKFFKKTKRDKIISLDNYYYGKILVKLEKDSIAIEKFKLAFKLDSNNFDLLTDIATAYTKLKDYQGAANAYQKKVDLDKASDIDCYYLGKNYYMLQQWEKADTSYAIFIARQPESMNGLIMRARTKTNLDTTSQNGLAIPYYEKVIEKALTDSVKYKKELIESYDYLGGYNVLVAKDYKKAKLYYNKILALDPSNEKAKSILNTKELKGVK